MNIENLEVALKWRAEMDITRANIKHIRFDLANNTLARLTGNSTITTLDLNLQQKSKIDLGEVKLENLSLHMSPLAKISATKENLIVLQKTSTLK